MNTEKLPKSSRKCVGDLATDFLMSSILFTNNLWSDCPVDTSEIAWNNKVNLKLVRVTKVVMLDIM